MQTLRHLRRSRSLTYLDLATLTNIPARALAEAEHGLRQLNTAERECLAFVLGLRPNEFTGASVGPVAAVRTTAQFSRYAPALLAVALSTTLATSTLQAGGQLSPPPLPRLALSVALPAAATGALAALPQPAAPADLAAAVHEATLAELRARSSHEPEAISPPLAAVPVPRSTPAPIAAPAFVMTAEGPHGCPVQAAYGKIVITQGYGVGSHAPAAVWGAIDLAIDSNGDGYAEPGATWYAPVVATHAGHVRVTLDSYPGGNHVWVNDHASPWRTGYAHLAIVTVISDQFVQPGDVIGLIGSTGLSSGPHLDYQVWNGKVNVDPTGLVQC